MLSNYTLTGKEADQAGMTMSMSFYGTIQKQWIRNHLVFAKNSFH